MTPGTADGGVVRDDDAVRQHEAATGGGATEAGAGRSIQPTSQFAGDDGSADPQLTRLLQGHAAGAVPLTEVVARLAETRVLVPVLAELAVGEDVTTAGGLTLHVDKEASSGVVALEAPDGRRALPVFTSVASMAAWRADARPVPVETTRAALSAVNEDWSLLVVDPAGPVTVQVPRPAVWALAQGERWRPALETGEDGTRVEHEVAEAIVVAAAPVRHVVRAHAEPGRKAEVAVVLALDPGLDRKGLDAVLNQVNARLGASEVISGRVDSLELRIGAAR